MLHMEQVGVRELRLHASRYLERVEAGEAIEVTRRGRVIAVMSPPAPTGESERDYLIATGQLIPARGDIRDLEPRPRRNRSISRALDELRDEER